MTVMISFVKFDLFDLCIRAKKQTLGLYVFVDHHAY